MLGRRSCLQAASPSAASPSLRLAVFFSLSSWELGVLIFAVVGVIFFWVPGVILFLFGYPLIFGWWSMLLLPITLAVFGLMQRWQARHVFRTLAIHPESDKGGFVGYLLAYQVLTSAAALRGYSQYLVRSGRRWK